MVWVALKMLTGNRAKYYAIIFGIGAPSGVRKLAPLPRHLALSVSEC